MRNLWIGVLLGASACRAGGAGSGSPRSIVVEVDNPVGNARKDVGVTVPVASLGDTSPYGWSVYDGETELPVQVDDTDTDGAPDVLAFQVSLGPQEHKSVKLVEKAPSRFPKRSHAVVHPEF